jgi:site-specific DNA-methyltransferase (adenine-specific)
MELICVARKPLDEKTVAVNVLRHGCGAINVDACRVEVVDGDVRSGGFGQGNRPWIEGNTIRHGRPLREARRNEQSDLDRVAYGMGLAGSKAVGETILGRWPANVIHDGSEEVLRAFPNAGGQQRATGPEFDRHANVYGTFAGVTPHEPRADTGSAARFFYTAKADKQDRLRSKHPTVKPVDLIRYLIRLVTPPGGTILDCFAGSGTTGMAALAEGYNAVLVEREAEYIADIRRRVAHVEGADTPLFA